MANDLILYNSLSRRKEIFKPIEEEDIRLYVCGPTVYDRAHIGNARPVLVFDLLYRLLRNIYGKENVNYVRNFTDVDDKINEKAREKKVKINEITEETIKWFHEDMDQLEALRPTSEPRATNYISQMITMIVELISKAYAYPTEDGHVFFSVEKFDDYGRLSNKDLDELVTGSRIENEESKKNPLDFVLWKPSNSEEPGWDSPWGFGRPGWHIECSAMSRDLLGENFDIHGGGIDLIFPHHENEIAQSVCASKGKNFANFWLHNGYLMLEGEKMSKSLNNFITVKELIENDFSGQAIRYVMLSTHYRQPINWTYKRLKEAENILEKWSSLKTLDDRSNVIPQPVFRALLDDLNSPLAISEIHKMFNSGNLIDANESCTFFGFNLNGSKKKNNVGPQIAGKITHLLEKRKEARIKKDFATADKIRESLLLAGVEINDNEDKTSWKIKDNFIKEKLENL